jgi:hypothetical protein
MGAGRVNRSIPPQTAISSMIPDRAD